MILRYVSRQKILLKFIFAKIMEMQKQISDNKYKHSLYIVSIIQFNLPFFQKRNFVVMQTKFNKHIVYSVIDRVHASSHPCALAQRGRSKER